METIPTESNYTGPQPARQEGESEMAFLGRQTDSLSELGNLGFAITKKRLKELGVNSDFLSALPRAPDNVILWLDTKTENVIVCGLPKGMDAYGLVDKAWATP